MKVLACGSRSWDDYTRIRRRLALLSRGTEIIHGGAKGADWQIAQIAGHLGMTLPLFRADWSKHGKRAGLIRNLQMLDENPDLVIAFWDGESPGTKHTITEAEKRGIPVEVVSQRVD